MIKKIIPFFIILSCVGCNPSNPTTIPITTQEAIEQPQAEVYESNLLQLPELPKEEPVEADIPNDDCTVVIRIVL